MCSSFAGGGRVVERSLFPSNRPRKSNVSLTPILIAVSLSCMTYLVASDHSLLVRNVLVRAVGHLAENLVVAKAEISRESR